MPVRALIAEEDLNLHQVVHDILEMSFKDLEIERAMNYDSLLNALRQEGPGLDLILYDLRFDQSSGHNALAVIRSEMPDLLPRLVVLAANGDELRGQEE
ncbi:MAG: response regulator, partial [Chitinivibrionales bacterium]|nr:response regulator [Chitinivibrionales bacterium]